MNELAENFAGDKARDIFAPSNRRSFLVRSTHGMLGSIVGAGILDSNLLAQVPGERPFPVEDVLVANPKARVPIGMIIDDSTCLVNVNHFAVPQFAEAWGGGQNYTHDWKSWPREIPDAFVRRFMDWCAEQGVRGKYSIVPYPACVGRLDRVLPGWSYKELRESLKLVREVVTPGWDIHPEMVTHTRVIDLKTGHPYNDHSLRFMENWEWTTGKSADEIGAYIAYALQILKNVDLPCEGITTPGGFGNRALPQLAQASFQALRDVYQSEIPHYFRHLYDRGSLSVVPRVEYAKGIKSDQPSCVVSIIACTGDWTGGWDNTPPEGPDRYITPDLKTGRMVEVIERGEPAFMLSHWTGFYFNGQEIGFKVFQEVVKRLKARFSNLIWMKTSELARYWAARELTQISRRQNQIVLYAPYECSAFTLKIAHRPTFLRVANERKPLTQCANVLQLDEGRWFEQSGRYLVCFKLPKGESTIECA